MTSGRALGQFSIPQSPGVRRLAATMRRTTVGTASKPPSQAVVISTAAGPPPTCTVSFDDGDNAPVRYLRSYTPTVGDLVEIVWRDGDPYIIGALA